jgi:hypothetical protein
MASATVDHAWRGNSAYRVSGIFLDIDIRAHGDERIMVKSFYDGVDSSPAAASSRAADAMCAQSSAPGFTRAGERVPFTEQMFPPQSRPT